MLWSFLLHRKFQKFYCIFFATLVHFSHNFVTKAEKLICMTNFWYVHQWGFKLTLSCVADNSNIFWYLSATNTISLCCQNSSIELIGPLMEVIDQKIGPFLKGQLFKNVKIYVWMHLQHSNYNPYSGMKLKAQFSFNQNRFSDGWH